MAENTHISWANDTFNPWEGCQKVGPGCDGCYAEARNARYAGGGGEAPNWGPGAPRRRTSASNWAKPLKWEREQAAVIKTWRTNPFAHDDCPMPQRFVFCASLADVFDNEVDPAWRRDLFDLIRATPHLTWLLLTKRPGNIVKLFEEASGLGRDRDHEPTPEEAWPRNAAIGFTAVNQDEFDRDWPKAKAAFEALNPAFVFVSDEPSLGLIDLPPDFLALRGRAWFITGGETDQGGHLARPFHPDWARGPRDQCEAAGVPYHHKQNGEFCEFGERGMLDDGTLNYLGRPDDADTGKRVVIGDVILQKVGKRRAGRFLDGKIHDARPVPRAAA